MNIGTIVGIPFLVKLVIFSVQGMLEILLSFLGIQKRSR